MTSHRFFLAVVLALTVFAGFYPLAAAEDSLPIGKLAGEYYYGDGLGANCTLNLLKDGTFAFQWSGCGGIYDQNDGAALLEDNVLRLTPSKPNNRDGFRGMDTALAVVRWGSRVYLVPPEEMVDFCSAVNDGSEPRDDSHGRYYLRRDQWNKAVKGTPEVLADYRKYLLAKSLQGKITKLIGKQEALLNLGAKDGLLPGMKLTAQNQGRLMSSSVKVLSADADQCRIKCTWKDDKLMVGQTVTSRLIN